MRVHFITTQCPGTTLLCGVLLALAARRRKSLEMILVEVKAPGNPLPTLGLPEDGQRDSGRGCT
jgi:hypothetical protein